MTRPLPGVSTSVAAPYSAFLLAAAEEQALDGDDLLESSGLRRRDLAALDGHLPWDRALRLTERIYEVSSPAVCRAIFRSFALEFPVFAVMAEAARDPRELTLLAHELTLRAFPVLRGRVTRPSGRRIELWLGAKPGVPTSPALFDATALVLAALPGAMGRPDARVTWELEGSSAVYRVEWARSKGRKRALAPASQALAELVATAQRAIGGTAPTRTGRGAGRALTLGLQQKLGLTLAEARVVARLARGLAPREIARELAVSEETVRSHLKQSYAKAGVRRQAELVGAVVRMTQQQSRLRAR